MRRIISVLILVSLLLAAPLLPSCSGPPDRERPLVVATNFAAYDFSRALCSGFADAVMLLSPGNESHDFEATVSDISQIEHSSLFVFTGGESDEWIEDLFEAMGDRAEGIRTFAMTEHAELLTEEIPGLISSRDEYDEHVWTSPKNALVILHDLAEELCGIFPEHEPLIRENLAGYSARISGIDERFEKLAEEARRKTVIVADRFPLKYLCEEYGFGYYAAFTGCTSNTEPSLSTISFLTEKVKEEDIPVIFVIELSDRKTAEFIAGETGAEILTLQSAHNVTKEEFDSSVTYADLMEMNLAALDAALN